MNSNASELTLHTSDTLKAQLEGIGALFVRGTTVLFVLVGLALLAVIFASRLLGRGRSRSSLALGSQAAFGVRLFTFLFATFLLTLFLYQAASVLITGLIAALAAGALVSVGFRSRSWVGGAWSILRGRIRTGNRLSLELGQGHVESFGLFHVVLRTDNGDQLYLPVSALHDHAFSISAPDKTVLVELAVRLATDRDYERLKQAAALCAYRDRRVAPILLRDTEDLTLVRLRFRSWSAEAAQRAVQYLRRVPGVNQTTAETQVDGRQ